MGKLIVMSGHSGSGKSTIMKSIMDNEIVSFTTRDIREKDGEVDGVDYNFISKEEFDNLYESGRLVEYTEYGGNFYGLTKDDIDSKLSNGDAFCIVDYVGMKQLKEQYDDVISIFLYTSAFSATRQMIQRGDDIDSINVRISTYHEELSNTGSYDYVIRNNYGKLDDTIDIVRKIIEVETDL